MTIGEIVLYCGAGFLLGGLHLAGLWLTVFRMEHVRRPLMLLMMSTAVRTLFFLAALALISGLEWQRLLASMAGFVAARTVVKWWPQSQTQPANTLKWRQ